MDSGHMHIPKYSSANVTTECTSVAVCWVGMSNAWKSRKIWSYASGGVLSLSVYET